MAERRLGQEVPVYTTLAAVKAELGIPPEDHSQDARLQDLMHEATAAIDAWIGRPLAQRRYIERIRRAPTVLVRSSVGQLACRALSEAIRYLEVLSRPDKQAQEAPGLDNWLASAKEALQQDPSACVLFTKELVRFKCGAVQSRSRATWMMERAEDGQFWCSRKLAVEVVRAGEGHQHLAVDIYWEPWSGPDVRSRLPRKVRTRLMPYTHRRLYLPHTPSGPRSMQSWGEAVVALMLLYLTQAGLVSIDEDHFARDELLSYLDRFRGARTVGAYVLLAELLAHYQIPEDYRAFTKYIGRTIRGLLAEQRGQGISQVIRDPDMSESYYFVDNAAASLGISKRRLYELVKSGTARIATVRLGGQTYRAIPHDELARLERVYAAKRLRQALIHWLARTTHTKPASARRQIERAEQRGQTIEAIVKKYPEFLQQCFETGDGMPGESW
jgi:hypothetical protein